MGAFHLCLDLRPQFLEKGPNVRFFSFFNVFYYFYTNMQKTRQGRQEKRSYLRSVLDAAMVLRRTTAGINDGLAPA